MMPTIPSPDPIPLPAPVWLLKVLLVALLPLHLIPMNLTLGGAFVAAWAAWRERHGPQLAAQRCRTLADLLARTLPVTAAFTITLGIAPLLFLQVLYGQLFYASSVLMAWPWLSVIGLLMVAYYSFYLFSFRRERHAPSSHWATLGAILMSAIAFLFVNNMTLMLHPERWSVLYAASESGWHLNVADPTHGPRFMHFCVAALAVTGLYVALLGRVRLRGGQEDGSWLSAVGVRLFVAATLVQFAGGIWFLISLPTAVRALFLGANRVDAVVLWSSVALAIFGMIIASRRLPLGITAIVLTIFGMSYVRHRVREAMLASLVPERFSTDTLVADPQWMALGVFLLILLAGAAVLTWMLRRFWRPSS